LQAQRHKLPSSSRRHAGIGTLVSEGQQPHKCGWLAPRRDSVLLSTVPAVPPRDLRGGVTGARHTPEGKPSGTAVNAVQQQAPWVIQWPRGFTSAQDTVKRRKKLRRVLELTSRPLALLASRLPRAQGLLFGHADRAAILLPQQRCRLREPWQPPRVAASSKCWSRLARQGGGSSCEQGASPSCGRAVCPLVVECRNGGA